MRFEMMHPADQLVAIMNRIYANGLTTMTGGNLSISEPNGDLWITPTGQDKGALTRNDIICRHPDGSQQGCLQPSTELPFHQAIYAACADTRAILHAHSPALTTFCIMNKIPTVNLIPNTRLVCGKVGLASYARTGSSELGEKLAAEFAKGYSVVLMENHGVCVAADTIGRAYMIFETLEYSAKIELIASRFGNLKALTEHQIDLARTEAHTRLSEFKPRQRSSEELAMRRDMTRIIRRALEQKLFASTQGTISARLSDGSFLITPYGIDRRLINEEHLVLVRRSMKEEGKTPSRAVFLNELIYHHRPDINAIIAGQPSNLMVFTLIEQALNTRLLPESYLQLKQLEKSPYGLNYSEPKKIVNMLSAQTSALLLENDGIIVTGGDLLQAFDRFELAEFTAKTQILVPQLQKLKPLSNEQIAELDHNFS